MSKSKSLTQWNDYIGNSLRKTAEATLETAKRIAEYRESEEEDVFINNMRKWFNFSPTNLSYWKSINDSIERFESSTKYLPSSTRTLYELSNIKTELWEELLESNDISPSMTVEQAKTLKTNGGIRKKISEKYVEADNYLEIMEQAKEFKDNTITLAAFIEEFDEWLKENPPTYDIIDQKIKDEESGVVKTVTKSEIDEDKEIEEAEFEEIPKTGKEMRVKCLAMFGIYIDKPITNSSFLEFLENEAGDSDVKAKAIKLLEEE